MRMLALVVALSGGPLLDAAPAGACACDPWPDLVQPSASAGAVFIGEPVELKGTFQTPFGESELWDFAVERVYVGPESTVIAVGGAAEGDSCHVKLGDFGRIGVVAQWRSGHLSVGSCGIVDADAMQEALGAGIEPTGEVQLATVDSASTERAAGPDQAATNKRGVTPRFLVLVSFAAVAAMGYGAARRWRLREESLE